VELLLLVALLLLASGFGAQDTTDLQITQTASPASEVAFKLPAGNITWTMIVMNNGPLTDTNVQVDDPMPAYNTYVASTTTVGSCTGGAVLSCDLGTMAAGDSTTITLVTSPTQEGHLTNTATASGDLTETTPADNTSSASVLVWSPNPPPFCIAVYPRPKQLHAGRSTTMHLKVTYGRRRPAKGVRVRITGGPRLRGFHATTKQSDAHGKIALKIKPKTRGVLYFKPIVKPPVYLTCGAEVGVIGVSTPPVTG
jgi:uncharacterized repeat protein (TIGR01451 family)